MTISEAQLAQMAATIVSGLRIDTTVDDLDSALRRGAKVAVKLSMMICNEMDQLPKNINPPDPEWLWYLALGGCIYYVLLMLWIVFRRG